MIPGDARARRMVARADNAGGGVQFPTASGGDRSGGQLARARVAACLPALTVDSLVELTARRTACGSTRQRAVGQGSIVRCGGPGSAIGAVVRGVLSLCGGRRVGRAGARRGTGWCVVLGHRPRDGVSVRARAAYDADRDAARRPARRRSCDGVADLLRLPALARGLHDRRAHRRRDLRWLADGTFQPGHVRVAPCGRLGAAARAARARTGSAGARPARRPCAAAAGSRAASGDRRSLRGGGDAGGRLRRSAARRRA